jgi:hypothetical protein
MELELDAFSGRQNPKWMLSEERAAGISSQIGSLSVAADQPRLPDLGFRGFVLRSGEESIRVFGGRVIIDKPGTTIIFRDTKGIQQELENEARGHGFAAVLGDSK